MTDPAIAPAFVVSWTQTATGDNRYVGGTADNPKVVATRGAATEFPEIEARRFADRLALSGYLATVAPVGLPA